MRRFWPVLILIAAGCGGSPSPTSSPAPSGTVDLPGEKLVLDALEERAREALASIDHVADRASWEREIPRLRRRLRQALGLDLLPEPRPRKIRDVGTLDRGDYRIEKVVYETLPGVDVPAHLYLPKADGRHPAILFVPGHWYADSKSKTDFQSFCISMARWGFVVLTYDPVGQGERGISLRDHRRTELLPVGVAQQAIIDFESLCALNLLRLRPDVDPQRIGMTGASGGGFNSWIVPALDPGIAVTVPVVGTSEFLEQIQAVRERDWYDAKEHCHFVPGLLRFANNHEFLAMVAPRPLLIIAAHQDHSFRIPGNRAVADYGSRLYHALHSPERLAYVEDETDGHGYQKRKREAAYGWFLKWLKGEGDGSPRAEPGFDVPAWDAPELRCFPSGGNRSAGPGLVALAASLDSGPVSDRKVTSDSVATALGLGLLPRLTASSKLEGNGPEVSWMMRDGVSIPGTIVRPRGECRGALVAIADGGRASLVGDQIHPVVQEALTSGMIVLLADPRGMGELSTGKPGWIFAVSLLLGENFVGRQAMDLVGGWRALSILPELRGKPVALLGSGPAASLAALYAAVLEPAVSGVILEGGFGSYRDFMRRPKSFAGSTRLLQAGEEQNHRVDREIPGMLIPFNILDRFDLPDLVGSVAPRPVAVLSTMDGDFEEHPGPGLGGFFRKLPRRGEDGPSLGANPSEPGRRGNCPSRVHAVEDYETDIEKRWWMAGKIETVNVPPGSTRSCRGTLAHDFDDRMGDPTRLYTAVIFNPVPGPPMGKNPRLSFRFWIRGGEGLKIQIYSLTNGYHRHLTLGGLPQGSWESCVVDMTKARRPDGTGGPLAEDERIDDIQFYAGAEADLLIDDIVLYEAAPPGEEEGFPARIHFTGWFDTGRQGKEWPGVFEIVPHEKPRTWKAARSVGGTLRLGLRGERALSPRARLRMKYRLTGAAEQIVFQVSGPGESASWTMEQAAKDRWTELNVPLFHSTTAFSATELALRVDQGSDLWVDDVILYEPGVDK
jgi:dienelactone hydrolase